jgi:hypothetical protein
MPREQINLSLSPETRDKLDMLVTRARKSTGLETSRTTIITVLVEAAAARVEAQTQKRIEPIRNGKKITGWAAYYGDHYVTTVDGAGSKDEAQQALDRFVYEELSR